MGAEAGIDFEAKLTRRTVLKLMSQVENRKSEVGKAEPGHERENRARDETHGHGCFVEAGRRRVN